MRRFLALMAATAVVSLGGVGISSAADMGLPAPVLKAPPVAAPWSWTGFYIGGNVGAGWGTTESTVDVGTTVAPFIAPATLALSLPFTSNTVNGFVGGGQVGYNYQIGFVVLGVEGDVEWENLEGTTPCVGGLFFCKTKHDWQADITGRVGVVAFDRALIYIKGGAVWQHSNYSANNSVSLTVPGPGGGTATASASASASDTRLGALLGTGIEYGFLPNWSAKVEYNFETFGSRTLNFPISASACATGAGCVAVPPPAINVATSIKDFDHIIKAGVNYRW